MKLYNSNKRKIENSKIIEYGNNSYLDVSRATDEELNNIGYYMVKYLPKPDRRYYTSIEAFGLNGNIFEIGYNAVDKNVEDVKTLMVSDLIEVAKKKMEDITSKYSNAEMSAWEGLEKEANSFLSGTPIDDCPMIKEEAILCNQEYVDVATNISQKAIQLRAFRNYVVSTRYLKTQEINSLTTIAECVLYESTPYDYIITQEDVDSFIGADSERPVVGAVIQRVKNNVKDW